MKKHFDFDFVVTGLSNYTNENSLELISKAILADPTASYVQVLPGVKSAEDIHTIASNLTIQSGSAGFNPSGSTDLGKVTLSVDKCKVNEVMDPYQLEQKYTQMGLQAGSMITNVPFEQYISEEKGKVLAKNIAKMYWQGDKAAGSGNFALVNGLITDLAADSARVTTSDASGAWSTSNIIASVQAMISAQNVDVLDSDSRVMFVSPAYYQNLVDALFSGNYFHVAPDTLVSGEFVFPGSNVKIVRTYGLQGSDSHAAAVNGNECVVLMDSRYAYWGTDLVSDYSAFEIFYSKDFDQLRFISRFKMGAAHLFGEYFVANF